MLRTLFSFRGVILLFGLIAIALSIALVGELGIVRNLTTINKDVARIRQGQLAVAAALQAQVDEETGIRGYASTRAPEFLDPYTAARSSMREQFAVLGSRLGDDGGSGPEDRALEDMRRVNATWLREIAEPVAAGKPLDRNRSVEGKVLTDRFRADIVPIRGNLDKRYAAAIARRDGTIRTATAAAIGATAVIALEVLFFITIIAQMRHELDRDRGVVEALQNAASARLVTPPHLRVAAAYRSATRGARVGGDVYDVYRLDDHRTLILVADVSGKGLTAAVDTTFVRYAMRALASESLAPDEIVRRFDVLYREANLAPESFVSLFVGIHDRRDASLSYTNAGHEACWIRRSAEVVMLEPTGGIVGLGLPFAAARTRLAPGEMLILATDGLTEARSPERQFVGAETLARWLAEADPSDPQRFADTILAHVARFTRGRIIDDLALLAVSPEAE